MTKKLNKNKLMIRPVLGASLIGMIALGGATLISNEHASFISSDPHASAWSAQVVAHQACESRPLGEGEEVRGLYGIEVPALASAVRQTFDGKGNLVEYSMRATREAVASFYSQSLVEQCWKRVAGEGLIFMKGAHVLRINLVEHSIAGEISVAYAQGVVAGVSTENIIWAAQDGMMPPPPPAGGSGSFNGGMPPPPSSGDSGQYPSPGGQYQPPSGGLRPPPSGQEGFPPAGFVPSNGQAPNQFPGKSGEFPGGSQGGQFGPGGQGFTQGGKPGFGNNQVGGQGQFGNQGPDSQGMNQFSKGNQGFGQDSPQGFSEDPQGSGEQQIDEQRFQMMKAGAKRFASEVKKMKTRIEQVKKKMKGCALPAELDNALTAADGLIGKIEAAQSADELEAVLTDIEDVTRVLQESGQDIPEYMRACEMKKRIGKDVISLEKKAKLILTKGKKDPALAELAQALEGDIDAVKALVKEGEALAGTDVSEAGAKFEEAYDKFKDIGDSMEALDIALDFQKNLARIAKKVKLYESAIARKEKKGEDMTEARVALEEMKSLLGQLQQAIKNKEGKDVLVDLMQSLYEEKQNLDELIGGPVDGQSLAPKFNTQEKSYDFHAPQGFERQMISQPVN